MASLVKRYTPPTCSLEIVGKVSPLSIYLQKPTLKELFFQLNFDDPRHLREQKITIRGDRTLLDSLCNAVREYVQDFLTQQGNITKLPQKTSQPYLHSQGLLHHKLHLGNLNQENSRQSIVLSAVQLFDLANALDEYSQEIASLPEFYRSQSRKAIPIVTAAGLILTVGLTVSLKLLQQFTIPSESVNSISSSEITPTKEKKPLAEVIPPQASNNQPITPAITPPNLTEREKLSPPPPVTPPEVPNLNQPSRTSAQSSNVEQKPGQTELVIIPQVKPQPQPTPTKSEEEGVIKINPQLIEPDKKAPSLVLESPPEVPTFQDNSQSSNSGDISDTDANFNNNLSQNLEIPLSPEIEEENPPEELPRSTNNNINETTTLFDYIPQVAEVRDYFQGKWQPPEDLKQTLQYRLVINKDGYLQTVIPLGFNAEIYLKQVSFPANSQSFVSPLSENNQQVIRLVLSPDGNVTTFLEN
jgi:hypothetical protein